MIKQFDLSALNRSSIPYPHKLNRIVDKKFRDTPDPEDDGKEVNRYVMSRIICSMLNDYSEEPDFVKEETNFTSLKGLSEEDWDDFKQAFMKRVSKNLGVTDLNLDKYTFAWTREEKREVKAFVDAVWRQISEEEPEEETSSKEDLDSEFKDLEDVDTGSSKEDDEDDDKKSDDKSKSKKEDDDDAEDEEEEEGDDESSSKSKKKDDEDDDDDDDDKDDEDEDEEDDSDDEDESTDEEDEEDEDDEKESKSKSKSKKDDDEDEDDDSEDEEEDDDSEDDDDKDEDDEESDSKSKSKKKEEDSDKEEDDDEDKSSKSKDEKSEEFLSELFGQTPADRLNKYREKLNRIRQAIHNGDNDTGCISYPLSSTNQWLYNPEDDTTPIKLPSPRVTLDYLNKVGRTIDMVVKFIHNSQRDSKNAASLRRVFESVILLKISAMFKGQVSFNGSSIRDTYLETYSKPVKWPNSEWYTCTLKYNVPSYVTDGYNLLDSAFIAFGAYALIQDRQLPMYNVIDALSVWYGKVVDGFIRIIRTLHKNTPVVHKDSPEADRLEQKIRATVIRNIREVEESQYPVAAWDSSAFTKDLRQLEMYRNYIRALDIPASNEGLGTGLLKVFIGVTDTFLKVGNTFKTNVFKFYKSLKRSEMRYYFESHTTMCLKVEGVPITTVSGLDVPIPSGMKGTYQNAVLSMEQVYGSLDMISFAQGTLASLIDLRRKLMRSEEYKNTMVPMENIMNQRAGSLPQMRLTLDKVFTNQKTPLTTNFMNVYKSMKEFKDVRVSLLDMEKYLADVNKMVNLVDDTNTVLADIISYLSEDSEVDKTMVASMINIVKFLANSYDLYGVTSTRQMAVEHNHIGSIGHIWSNIK